MESVKVTSTDLFKDEDLMKVQKCMAAIGWQWRDENERRFSPTVDEMRTTIDSLLTHLEKGKTVCWGTGGFYAEIEEDENGKDHFREWFELVSGEWPE